MTSVRSERTRLRSTWASLIDAHSPVFQQLGIRAGDYEGDRLRLWRKRRIAPHGNVQAVAQCIPR